MARGRFCVGGSSGYDHKGMGITARGAWESVKLHFRELGLDVQQDSFTVIGIGDMSGDVFATACCALRQHVSEQHLITGTFLSILIRIRRRASLSVSASSLYRKVVLGGDYDCSIISSGGGVWSRSTKSIELSALRSSDLLVYRSNRLTPE